MAARNRAHSSLVTGDEGNHVRLRRERLGMDKSQLAREAGVSRETLAAIERGEGFRRSTLTKIEHALDEAEKEAGLEAAPLPAPPAAQSGSATSDPHVVTIRGTRGGDIDVVVSGPIGDIDKLAETVERLLRSTR